MFVLAANVGLNRADVLTHACCRSFKVDQCRSSSTDQAVSAGTQDLSSDLLIM
jgi:hypothetical protein